MVTINKLKLTILQQRILRLFFIKAGASLYPRKIALLLGVSPPAVSKAVPLLIKKQVLVLQKEPDSQRTYISLNRDDPFVLGLKRADNLRQLYESGLVQYLYDHFSGATIILFGSYALGEDTITSDIDLAVIGVSQKQVDFTSFEKILERSLVINYYSSFQQIDKALLNNILNGITLKGFVAL